MSTSPTIPLDLRYSTAATGSGDGHRSLRSGTVGAGNRTALTAALPQSRSPSRGDQDTNPGGAAALLAAFRDLSNSRDAALTRVDRTQSPAQQQQQQQPLASPSLRHLSSSSGTRHSPLWQHPIGIERTITIGSHRDAYSPDGPTPAAAPLAADRFLSLQRGGSRGGHQRHVVRGDTGVFSLPGSSIANADRRDDARPLATSPPEAWNDEDCFDRTAVVEGRESTLVIGASPREYAPEYDHEYPVPQPELERRFLRGDDGSSGGDHARSGRGLLTEGDAFVRHGEAPAPPFAVNPIVQVPLWSASGDQHTQAIHSPPPRVPSGSGTFGAAVDEFSSPQASMRSPNGGVTIRVHNTEQEDGEADAGQSTNNVVPPRRRSASEDFASVGDSRSASPLLAFYGADGEPAKSDGAWMDFFGKPIPVPPALAVPSSSNTQLPATRSPPSAIPYRQQRPSKLLVALVEAVAYRRQAAMIPTIPISVIHAFDNVVVEGAYFIKYSLSGAPHERYFSLRFVDVARRAPEPCLLWSVHRTSWSAKGLVNLASIVNVYAGTGGSPAFQKYLLDGTRIRGPMLGGPHRSVLPTTFAFVVESFGTEEPLSLLSLSRPQFDAWIRFLRFIASIGKEEGGLVGSTEGEEGEEYDYAADGGTS